MTPDSDAVALHDATRHRYLHYALSVITARALPDVRDGLKPVQRRILYAMYRNLRLLPDERYRKSAAVVGEVMAKYHPHGDSSIYEALVRMAQPFSLLHPLVDGQGNFGSLDGDEAAAMRYTECKLRPLAVELLSEIGQRTVDFRPNYDGQHQEPVVLPAQIPHLLVHGAEGIAVGMATRIPPHNLREVIDAAVLLLERPDASDAELAKRIPGPDFPTGGVVLTGRDELQALYTEGRGSIALRGRWTTEKSGRKHLVIITEIPYAVNKAKLVARIGELVAERKVPQLVDVRDESTEEVRVVLELRAEGDEAAAMAFLCKHTPLQTNFPLNMTCLVPAEEAHLPGRPERLPLREVLRHWLEFREETVRRRLRYELEELRKRIHILEGFAIVFDALDEAIALIRRSEGKRDAAERLMARCPLDDAQAEAILELRLHQLARLAIDEIRAELAAKRARAAEIEALLASPTDLRAQVKAELLEIRKLHGQKRRTTLGGEAVLAYNEDDYIVAEDAWVIVTRDGYLRRQGSFSGIEKLRVREGDAVGWVARVSTRSTLTFFTSHGSAYTLRVDDVPSTTGHGEPVGKHFKFDDGEQLVGVAAHDSRARPRPPAALVEASLAHEEPPPPWGVAVTAEGRGLRFELAGHAEPSNTNGRRFAKLDGEDRVLAVLPAAGDELLCLGSRKGRGLCYPVVEIAAVRGPSKGVTAFQPDDGDALVAAGLTTDPAAGPTIESAQGVQAVLCPDRFEGPRTGRGKPVFGRAATTARAVLAPTRLGAASTRPTAEDPADDAGDDEE